MGHKPPTPWEAASRHPLGLVDEAFAFQNLQQAIASNVRSAAQRKLLPEPPAEWKARVSSQAVPKTQSSWNQSRSKAPLCPFLSPTKSTASAPAVPAGFRSLPRQWLPQRSVTEANIRASGSRPEYRSPLGQVSYKATYNTTSHPWRS
ncbi:synaptopodin-2 [Osmerus mordax]